MGKLNITLKNNSEREQITKQSLEKLLNKYDLDRWILCNDVVIEQDIIAHSHPVVTIACWRNYDEGLLAQFLHEQIHWIEQDKKDVMAAAIQKLKLIFPDAPVGRPEGADNEASTYRHLIICRLEFLALSKLLGEDRAKEVTLNNKSYTWIRRAIIEHGSKVDQVIKEYFPKSLQF